MPGNEYLLPANAATFSNTEGRLSEQSRQGLQELRTRSFAEILPDIRKESTVMILDFTQLPAHIPEYQNIRHFFETTQAGGGNPRLPEQRQHFNNRFLSESGKRYLLSRYAENRIAMLQGSSIAAEGRTYHLGVDIFTEGLDTLYTPYRSRVVRAGREEGKHTYGYYAILEFAFENSNLGVLYSLFGHLSRELPTVGSSFEIGQPFAQIGDFVNDENGGWSRHVHFQLLRELPAENEIPIGYSTWEKLPQNLHRFPDPNLILQLQLPGLNLI